MGQALLVYQGAEAWFSIGVLVGNAVIYLASTPICN
jgi:hypothetical protein